MTETQTEPPSQPFAAVVLAAGDGKRMKSALPKVLHPIAGRPMIAHLMAGLRALAPARIVVVIAPGMDAIEPAVHPAVCVEQDPPLGTGHAVLAARAALADFTGDVMVLFGDCPLMTIATMRAMLAARGAPDDPAVVVLGFRPDDPAAYGRLVVDGNGHLTRIVEYRDASAEERALRLCNGGAMAIDGRVLFELLDAVGNGNDQGEYYLTDIVGIARDWGRICAVVEGAAAEVLGINSRQELAAAEAVVQRRLRRAAMADGATLIDPETVWFSHDTRLGRDVVVEPHVVFGPGVEVGDGVRIKAFSHLEGARLAPGAEVGPYARLRPGTEIGAGAKIGNFVEVKQASIDAGAKVNHLSYIGDAHVGAEANVGAGTITCNYDGFFKYRTEIGAGAFIGSNTALVAPVTVGAGAIIGAGSVINKDVAADALALARAPQKEIGVWAAGFRAKRQAQKRMQEQASEPQAEPDTRRARTNSKRG